MINDIIDNALNEIQDGYVVDSSTGVCQCLVCGLQLEQGEIFEIDGRFFEAQKAIRIHIEKEHGGMFQNLLESDKKYTGLTENQKELLALFKQGLSDSEIAGKTGVAASTVRHQRFVFREKARQAKAYLALYNLSGIETQKGKTGDEPAAIHKGARMVDDRYNTTLSEEEKVYESCFVSLKPLVLKVFPAKEKKKIVVLKKIAAEFESGRTYSEKEINSALKAVYSDYVTIRRYLIEYGFMTRKNDCSEYVRTNIL